MKWWTILITLFALTFAIMIATAQQFDMQPGAAITQIDPAPAIRVRAVKDPAVYDTIDPSDSANDLVFQVKMRGSCPETYRLSNVTASISNEKPSQRREVKIGFNPEHRSIGPEHGAKWDFTTLSFPFLPPSTSPAMTCNRELERRTSMGESRTELLRKGFDIKVQGAYRAYLSVTCHKQRVGFYEDPDYVAETRLPLTVQCMPSDYKPPRTKVEPQRTAVPDPPIESVSVAADPFAAGQCPLNITFRGKLTAPADSEYSIFKTKYRFIGENNFATDWIAVSVARGETKTVIWRRYIETPQTDRTGDFKTPGGRVKIPLYRGWMLLEVMLPHGVKRSERIAFTVDCNAQNRMRPR